MNTKSYKYSSKGILRFILILVCVFSFSFGLYEFAKSKDGEINLGFVSSAQAQPINTYFVSLEGDDDNPGTESDPWRTVQYSVDQLAAGDLLFIKAGEYEGDITIRNSGTLDHPIIISSFEDDLVKINAVGHSFGIVFDGVEFVTVKGLEIFGANGPHNESCNVHIKNKSSNITIQENEIHGGDYGILNSDLWTDHDPTHISIIDNQIHDNGLQGIRIFGTQSSECSNITMYGNDVYDNGYDKTGDDSEWAVGIYLRCDHSTLENNQIHDNNGEGVFMDAFSSRHYHHNVVKGNHIYRNGWNGIMFAGQDYSLVHDNNIHDNGIYFLTHEYDTAVHGIYALLNNYNIFFNNEIYNHAWGAAVRPEGHYNVFRDNDFYHNGYGFGQANTYGTCYGHIIRNNRVYDGVFNDNWIQWPTGHGVEADPVQEFHLFHNVFFDNDASGAAFSNGSSGIKIKNNIIMNSGADWSHLSVPSQTGYEENHNLIYPDRSYAVSFLGVGYDLAGYQQASHQGQNSISLNPQFVDPGSYDFHLQATSPAIDAGGFLTYTTNSGNGNKIPVQDALWFTDGFGIDQGDLIQLEGQTQRARVIQVDYDNHILTLDQSMTWTDGQGVTLAYEGSAPDIGVFEYSASTFKMEDINRDGEVDPLDVALCVDVILLRETNPEIVSRADVNEDGVVDVLDVQRISNAAGY
jgi:hypothetical protein